MKLLKNEWLQFLILAAPFCVAALLWDNLPEKFPCHWNIRGDIDGYTGRNFGALFMPLINVGVVALIFILPRLDPKSSKYDKETKSSIAGVFKVCRLSFSIFFTAMSLAVYAVALHYQINFARFIFGGMGAMIAVMGNSMGKLRPNWFAGFRTPWSLESRSVWIKTHRLGGRLMVASGILLFVESLFLPTLFCFFLGIVPLIILVGIVPAAYSYFSFQAEKKERETMPLPKG